MRSYCLSAIALLVTACSSGSSSGSTADGATDGSAHEAGKRDGSGSGSGSRDAGSGSGHGHDASHGSGSGSSGSSDGGGSSDSAADAAADVRHDAEHDAEHDVAVDTGPDASAGGPPSCRVATKGAGTSYCGANDESCCTSLEVTGDTYFRTYTNTGTTPTNEADPATISSFRLDKYLVTVARFRQFRDAVIPADGGTGWVPAPGSGKHTHLNNGKGLAVVNAPGSFESGWLAADDVNVAPTDTNLACATGYSTWSPSAGDTDALPINCVDWAEAYAFCIWDGGFLPSEAEWEFVAAGGASQLAYPWGATTPGTLDTYAIYGCHYPEGFGTCSGVEDIAAVGSAPMGAALFGQVDMAGNTYEWTLDLLGAYVSPCTDCAALGPGTARVIRGGDFRDSAQFLLPPAREENTVTTRTDTQGFRCARTP